jgi:hypothetical protein
LVVVVRPPDARRAPRHSLWVLVAIVAVLLFPATALAQTFKVVVVRATFSDDASNSLTHLYSLADVQATAPELEDYYRRLSYGSLALTVTAADAPDLAARSSYSSSTDLYNAVFASAARAGYTAEISGANAVILLTAGYSNGFCGAWYGGVAVTGVVTGSVEDIREQEGCGTTTAIGLGPSPANVDWGGWAHEIGHALQDANGRSVIHPAGYGDAYNLMDSCYPCGAGVFDLTGSPVVGGTLSAFAGWLPASKVTILAPPSSVPTTTTIPLAPLGEPPSTVAAQQGIKIPLTTVDVPVSSTDRWRASRYYLVDARRRIGADAFGAPGLPRLADEGIEIHEADEARDPPVKTIRPCDETPSGRRCEGDPGAEFPTSYCDAHRWPLTSSCWPFSLWHPGDTYHGLDGIAIAVGAQRSDGAYPITITSGQRTRGPDPYIIPWQTPPMNTWETVDLWVDSSCNGYERPGGRFGIGSPHALRYGRRPGRTLEERTVISNGDDPCADHENRVYARVHNGGDEPATGVQVHFKVAYANFADPAHPTYIDLGTVPVPSIQPGGLAEVYTTWTPSATFSNYQLPLEIQATVEPPATNVSTNLTARENILHYDSRLGRPLWDYPALPLPIPPKGDPARFIYIRTRAAAGARVGLGGRASFRLAPGTTERVLPLDVAVPAKATAGQSFVGALDVMELRTELNPLIGPTWPAPPRHTDFDTLGGTALIAQVVSVSKVTARVTHTSGAVVVRGRLRPALRAHLMIDYISPKETGAVHHLVATDSKGFFTDRLARSKPAAWHARVLWTGDASHSAAFSWRTPKKLPPFKPILPPPVPPFGVLSAPEPMAAARAELRCPGKAFEGEEFDVDGSIDPALADQSVAISYTAPDRTITQRVVRTTKDGRFSDVFAAEAPGRWTLVAHWNGDAGHVPADSNRCSTFVEIP